MKCRYRGWVFEPVRHLHRGNILFHDSEPIGFVHERRCERRIFHRGDHTVENRVLQHWPELALPLAYE